MHLSSSVGIMLLIGLLPGRLEAQTKTAFGNAKRPEESILERPARLRIAGVSRLIALTKLSESSGVGLAFSPTLLRTSDQPVNCDCEHLPLGAALDRILLGAPLRYRVLDGQVVITPEPVPNVEWGRQFLPRVDLASARFVEYEHQPSFAGSFWQQGGVIAGLVLGGRSEPIDGARLAIAGTLRSATTDASGRFRLTNLSGTNVTLEISKIGYRRVTQTVLVGDTAIRVTLLEAAINLDELIVTGVTGAVEKRAIGNAIATVRADVLLEHAPIRDVGDLLSGRTAGVVVLPGTGVAGGGPKIEVRGRTTISLQSEPLIYVDGVRSNNDVATGPLIGSSGRFASRLGDLNPEEIESIEIIRGPAAATLYGTEASNGVIQIITKKGRSGQRPAVGLSISQGGNWFMNADGRIPTNWARDPATGEIFEYDHLAEEAAAGRPIFGTGHLQSYNADLSGATGIVRYFLATGFDRNEGIEPTNRFKRFSARANLTVAPSDAFDVTANVGVTQARRDFNLDRGLSLMFALLFGNPATRNTPLRGFNGAPPEVWWSAYETFQDVNRYITGLQMNHRPWSWLRHKLTVGVDQAFEDNQVIIELQPDSINQFLTTPNNLGRKIVDRRLRTVSTFDYGATANLQLSGALRLGTSAGAQYYRDYTESQFAEGRGFPLGDIRLVSSASQTFGGDEYVTNTTLGFYWQEELSLNNRIFLTGAMRSDQNSAFGETVRRATYPKVSGSWVVSEEPFWNVGWVNALKLRAAYGRSGLHPVAFSALRTYRPTTSSTGSAVTPGSVGNPDLGPEQAGEVELGFEAGAFDGRLGIDFTYYDKRTKDMIILRDIAPSTGFPERQYVNAGSVKSNGFELLLNVTPVESRPVTWNAAVNFSMNDNKILVLDPENPSLEFITAGTGSTAFTLRHAVGYPIGSRFSKRIVSATYNPVTGRAEDIMCDGGPDAAPMPCATAPYLYIGRGTPKWQGGVSNTFTILGKLTLHAQMDFKIGNVKFDQDTQARCALFRLCEINFRPENSDPIDVAYAQLGSLDVGAKWFPDASFLKLRELAVSYDLPTSWVRPINATRASINLAGRNLFTYAPNYTSLDPESLDFGAAGITNYYEQTTTPQLATVLVTLRVTW